jgi:hypothetical protein
VLASLRRLGKGYDFDDTIALGSNISGNSCREFHHHLCERLGVGNVYDRWVMAPADDDVVPHMRVYEAIGFPGAIGSVDGVHIPWERCPAGQKSYFVGKEGFATVMYNCVVNHQGRFLSVSGPFCGTRNDKTAVKFDDFVMDIKEGTRYADTTFEL